MPNSGGASALPPLGLPSDNYDLIQSATVGLAGVGLRHRNGVDADDSLPSPTAAAHAELISAALALAPPSMQPSKSVKHPQAGGASTYTLQYIGVSNGELGILSQKQKLVPPKLPAGPVAAATGATSRAKSAALRSRSSSALSIAGAGSGSAAGSRPSSSTSPSPSPIRSTYNPTLPPHAPREALSLTAAGASASGDEAAGFAPSPSPSAVPAAAAAAAMAVTAPGRQQPHSGGPVGLQSLVEDAHGSVRVVSDCFYSRALHSRTGPRDRHTRRNKPTVPPVQDKEPMSAALPARFGHRAPSAGGFPGWRLTAATAAANAMAAGPGAGASAVPGMRGPGGGSGGAGGGAGMRRAYTGNGNGAASPSDSAGSQWQQQQQQQREFGEAGEDEQGLGYGYMQPSPQVGPVLELPQAGELPPGTAGGAAAHAVGGRSFSRSTTAGNRPQCV
ncbi:hypothetical protein CHLRE_11g480600v5 [Chlamydomonas reinhardtii]|uniref:Uncharacterized protein n=1 Tax=Chlamydomonas reinhardtii TaxID=3055 RepID=A0A2K3D8N7_CHLRE|nr:uncharacterized protein CHLRE_11g480600v5 [Chlamydomonas reinhardtii]XP_042919730.1 uncharacterized protein CHLRE_11g480600v5 [Chlamydomonas reinhardtii]PNW76898.1 hypothetical protein CHLRE_11g480600v5 [Chlamydomonas reinhardtii]PNW76899.1 hypothetical protein CHLRE_11g480600v5 [Chlamydomonas reinhardtii]